MARLNESKVAIGETVTDPKNKSQEEEKNIPDSGDCVAVEKSKELTAADDMKKSDAKKIVDGKIEEATGTIKEGQSGTEPDTTQVSVGQGNEIDPQKEISVASVVDPKPVPAIETFAPTPTPAQDMNQGA